MIAFPAILKAVKSVYPIVSSLNSLSSRLGDSHDILYKGVRR